MRRVSLGMPAAALLTAAALAACGGGEGPPGATGDVVTVEPDDPVRIRTMLSLTGASSLGEPLRNGIALAAEDFHRVHGHPIDIGESLDGKCSEDGGAEAARIAIADPQALGVIGTSCSAAAVAAAPLISVAGLTIISPSNTSPVLTSDLKGAVGGDHHPGYFRVSNNDLYQGAAVADFAWSDLGLRRVTSVHDGDPYTSALAGAFADAFRALGGEVPVVAVVEKGDTDMTAVLAEFAAAEPDGVFIPLFRNEGSELIRQAGTFDELENAAIISGAARAACPLRVPSRPSVFSTLAAASGSSRSCSSVSRLSTATEPAAGSAPSYSSLTRSSTEGSSPVVANQPPPSGSQKSASWRACSSTAQSNHAGSPPVWNSSSSPRTRYA